MKLGFGFKIGLAISLLAVGATAGSLAFFYTNTKKIILEQMGNRLKDIGRTSAHLFGPEEREAIKSLKQTVENAALPTELVIDDILPGDYRRSIPDNAAQEIMNQDDFQKLVAVLRLIKDSTRNDSRGAGGDHPTLAYTTILTTIDSSEENVLRFLADADYDDPEFPNPVGNLFYNNSRAIAQAFGGSVVADADFRYENSAFLLSAGIPLTDDGRVLAVLSLDYDAQSEVNKVNSLWHLCIAIVIASFILSMAVAFLLARLLNRPIRKLREGAEKVAARDFTTRIEIGSKDELGLLADAFNSMVTEIKEYALDLENHNIAYARFVPREFLKHLGQESILQVKLGDQVQKQMTVLFSDIRSFTTISESMSPRDNFNFINDYLSTVSPIIRAHGGFVDKYIGDAVMALFPDSAESAVKAALEMQTALQEFNRNCRESGKPAIKIGIGLHNGNLMLGTVGESLRMEGTVISDAVNLSSRLEGLTKEYGADIIISEKVYNAISDRNMCNIRFLGPVNVKGKRNGVNIFEVVDSNDEDLARRKIITANDFENGIKLLEKKRYEKALLRFRKVLKISPRDIAARNFLDRCEKMLESTDKSKKGTLYSVQEPARRRGTDK